MVIQKINISNIPSIIWGEKSDNVYIFVHGKKSNKEDAKEFAQIATDKDYQVLSFDLPEHGERTNENYLCNIWNGVKDLKIIGQYAVKNWQNIYLFACSLGYISVLLPTRICY